MPGHGVSGQPRQRRLDALQQERVNRAAPAARPDGCVPDWFGQGASRLARLEARGRCGPAGAVACWSSGLASARIFRSPLGAGELIKPLVPGWAAHHACVR